MCRLGALQISTIKPLLAANGVNLVAVGLEQLGVEEFIERKFFDGGKNGQLCTSLINSTFATRNLH